MDKYTLTVEPLDAYRKAADPLADAVAVVRAGSLVSEGFGDEIPLLHRINACIGERLLKRIAQLVGARTRVRVSATLRARRRLQSLRRGVRRGKEMHG